MTPDDERWAGIREALRSAIVQYAPDWSDSTIHDPGITIVELFAFLGENLIARAGALPEDERSRLAATIAALKRRWDDEPSLTVRVGAGCHEQFTGPTRVNFFHGQLLNAGDLRDEQEYRSEKRRLHNRLCHGIGIVSGLGISLASGTLPAVVTVGPGLALDALGREVQLTAPVSVSVTETASPQLVMIEYVERRFAPVPIGSSTQPTRVEEGARVCVSSSNVQAEHVAIGRLVRAGDAWQVDPSFEPRRVLRQT
jgi:hypothetical protein